MKNMTGASGSNKAVNTLHGEELTGEISLGNAPSQRRRAYVNLYGVKFCIKATNNAAVPAVFNVAVVMDKYINYFGTEMGPEEQFFTDNGSNSTGLKVGMDFDDVTIPQAMKPCLPINSKRFTVLWRTKRVIGSTTSEDNRAVRDGPVASIEKYVKIGKRINYDIVASSQQRAIRKIWLVYWMSPYIPTSTLTPDFRLDKDQVIYFSDR